MSAGTGIRHAEASDVATRIFQIWIRPRVPGGAPRWHTGSFPRHAQAGGWLVMASGYADDADALPLQADARLLRALVGKGETLRYPLGPHRKAYLVVAQGRITLSDVDLAEHDGAAVQGESELRIEAIDHAEIVLVVLGGVETI